MKYRLFVSCDIKFEMFNVLDWIGLDQKVEKKLQNYFHSYTFIDYKKTTNVTTYDLNF